MKWLKKGLIFRPEMGEDWMVSHAQVPTALVLEDRVRVYFSSRPERTLSLTSYVDLDKQDLSTVLYINPEPILKTGRPGTFDEHGIMPGSIVKKGDTICLYYSGWSQGVSVPYSNYTGLAISEDRGTTFSKVFEGPVIDRTKTELYSATSPCVYLSNDSWRMWYSSGTHWLEIDGKLEHTYEIKLATSVDGYNWTQTDKTIIAQRDEFEAITRPAVIKHDDTYHMWFSFRGSIGFRINSNESYRLGYAFSDNLDVWSRRDELAGISLSDAGWDSKMIAYPNIVKIDDRVIMFYNGNNFGEDGFGYAELII